MHNSTDINPKYKYLKETDFVHDFLELINGKETPWGGLETTVEWDYRNGVTDVLARTSCGKLVAFEAKLKDWKRATHQAYKNTSFVDKAYVVMPADVANRIDKKQISVFQSYGVGLCTVVNDSVSILIEANKSPGEPLLPWISKKAHIYFDQSASDDSQST